MATNDPTFLAAFGNPNFFREAFGWDMTKITKWMEDCCEGKTGGVRTLLSKVRDLLKSIYEKFSSLIAPQGLEYLNPKPESHFLRAADPDWISQKEKPDRNKTMSCFMLRRWRPNEFPFNGVFEEASRAEWWHPYDLLGLFLSVLGPAPSGASKENFFIPLTAVYGQWCSRISGGKAGVGYLPAMFQITWREWIPGGFVVAPGPDYFLGSSLGLDKYPEEETGQWKVTVQRARFDMFYSSLRAKLFKQTDFDNKLSPVQFTRNRIGQTFGNCAETYPFLTSFNRISEHNQKIYGLALSKNFVKGVGASYNPANVEKCLTSPCLNCQQLITYSGTPRGNFHMKAGDTWGPKPKPEKIRPVAEAGGETIQPSAVDNPPEGWSNSADDIDKEFYWGPDGDGTAAAAKAGLISPTPRMVVDRSCGYCACIFTTSNNKVYLWNMITQEVYEFTKPTVLADIVTQLGLPSEKGSVELTLLDDAS